MSQEDEEGQIDVRMKNGGVVLRLWRYKGEMETQEYRKRYGRKLEANGVTSLF
jgi:hypothetical protein